MEAVIYSHATADAALRRADLRQAMQAFLADTSSRAAIQLVGLFVRIPTPSTITAAVSTATPSAAQPSTGSTKASSPRRQRSTQKLAWCALEADRRLRQAAEDAAELNRWILHGTLTSGASPSSSSSTGRRSQHSGAATSASSSSSSSSSGLMVVVVAYLCPQAREDLAVYESWQRCAEAHTEGLAGSTDTSGTTRRLSPLRRASFVACSLGAPTLLLSWSENPTRCHLTSLLLPHQSLLLDLSWCITASVTSGVEVVEAGAAKGSRVTSQVLLDLFLQDVLPCVNFPKGDSRTAFWVSYASLMAALHPRVFHDDNGADLSLAAHTPPPQRYRGEARANVNAEAFAKTHRLLRQLFGALFGGNGAAAPGRTQALRVLLGYGGATNPLRRQLVHVAGQPQSHAAAPAVDAALLRTRSLVDVYALFGVLVGQDRTDFYAAAAAFVRTAKRRSAAVPAMPASVSAVAGVRRAVESALVHVVSAEPAAPAAAPAAAAAVPQHTPNAFVELGARALARRRTQLERRRLGKDKPHLRPRERAARATRHRALARTARLAATAASSKAGQKRGAEQMEGGCSAASNAPSDSASAKQKRKTEAMAEPAATESVTAAEGLSWSVDVG